MNTRRVLAIAALITLAYLAALVWVDSGNDVFARLPRVAGLVPALAAVSLLSYLVRYTRWWWLLRRTGHAVPMLRGWLAYLTGFAFTATPGKVGELVRIRYFAPLGIPADRVLAAFVFERASDLVAIVLLAAVAVADRTLFALVVAFVAFLLGLVAFFALQPHWLGGAAGWFSGRGLARTATATGTLQRGLAGCRAWMNLPDAGMSLLLGLVAWGISALSFAWLLDQMGAVVALRPALAVFPTAMLAGAASLLPGGIGTTELTLVALLALQGVAVGTATLAAVAMRLSGLWFSVGCGLMAILALERVSRR